MLNSAALAFFVTLEKSRLLTDEQLAQLRAQAEREGENSQPQKFALRLVAQNWLTKWQAQMLLGGRKAFFFGKYKLLDLLGKGGMGSVFKAEQKGMNRIVALKIMSRHVVKDEAAVNRFRREIEAAAALNHPNIVMAFDADCEKDTHFLVMEYVAGEDLDSLVKKKGALPIADACEYIRQAADGLQHAHERSMVHRDIKPSNLLLSKTPDGDAIVKILDMGLARFASEASGDGGLTQSGQIMGTPDYIAPEQARNTKTADIRSDIYSLGCTLFRLLTGKLPFTGDSVMEKLMARATGDAPQVNSLRPDVPVELNAIVARMLARDPARRFQTPQEVAQALSPFANAQAGTGSSVQLAVAVPVSPPEGSGPQLGASSGSGNLHAGSGDTGLDQFLQNLDTTADSQPDLSAQNTPIAGVSNVTRVDTLLASGKSRSRKPADRSAALPQETPKQKPIVLIAVAAAVVLVAVAGFVVWNSLGATRLVIDWPAAERADGSLEVNGNAVALASSGDIAVAGSAGQSTLVLKRAGYQSIEKKITLVRGETKTFTPEWRPLKETTRTREWAELQKELQTAIAGWKSLPNAFEAAKIHSTTASVRDFVRRWPTTTEALQALQLAGRLPAPADTLSFADIPDEELAVVRGGATGSVSPALVAVLGDSRFKTMVPVNAMAISSDGKWIAAGSHDNRVRLMDATTGRIVHVFNGHAKGLTCIAFNPKGDVIASSSDDNTVRLWSIASRKSIHTLKGHGSSVRSIAFSPGGDQLVSGSDDNTLRIWDTASGKEFKVLPGHTNKVSVVAWSPDGKLIASGADDGTTKLRDAVTGVEKKTIADFKSVNALVFSPDSRSLASAGNDKIIKLWDTATGTEKLSWSAHKDNITALVFSPDGKYLASAAAVNDRTVKVWDVPTGAEKHSFDGHANLISDIAFTGDGKTLVSGGTDGMCRVWDVVQKSERFKPVAHAGIVTCVACSPDGTRLASAGAEGAVIIWDLAARQVLHTLRGHTRPVQAVAFSPDGKTLASGGEDQMIQLWDVETGRELRTLIGHVTAIQTLQFSPDGKSLVSGAAGRGVVIWNVAEARMDRMIQKAGQYFGSAAISPDGKLVAIGGQQNPSNTPSVNLWVFDAASGDLKAELTSTQSVGPIRSVAFHPDGKTLAALTFGNTDDRVRIWSIGTSNPLREFGKTLDRTNVAFSPDGSRFAWTPSSGELRVVETFGKTNGETISLTGSGAHFREVIFTPDGRHLLTANPNGTIYVLRLTPWEPAK